MTSGSHSLTLGRLYAWEKKLYEEVKVNLSSQTVFPTSIIYSQMIKILYVLATVKEHSQSMDKLYQSLLPFLTFGIKTHIV